MNQKIHKVEVKLSIKEISKEIWNELTNEINNPFYEWTWLKNLEISKSCLLYTSDAADDLSV